jgi:hypothetical protein
MSVAEVVVIVGVGFALILIGLAQTDWNPWR